SQVHLIADRHPKLETIDTINLMNHPQQQQPQQNLQQQNGSGGSGSSPDQSQSQQPQRRKKASRACFHCQKAHLTCDDSRPCQRCVKRDLAATCADGVRKKAKYLQDAYDAQQLAAGQASQNVQDGSNTDLNRMDQQLLTDQDQQQRQSTGSLEGSLSDPNSLFNFPMTSDYGFGSEAVNLEYSIISTMLSSPTAELNNMSDLSIVENWQRQGLDAMASMANSNQLQKALGAAAAAAAAAAASGSGSGVGSPNVAGVLTNGANTNNNNNNLNNASSGILGPGTQPVNATNNTSSFQHPVSRASKRKFPSNTPENVYANTKQPFNYTDGFHYLLRYVRERMDKEEMMRICRAMAMFRPSFIALIMNLTPEDLIFMEKCFQRTILEFEKLISFSGTPTVVWRRTGEIALVGKEFSLLTQWGRDQLVGKKTYIYELMDNQSAVEYWEKFSTHAFENTEQTCVGE
ncbi:Transcriptional regulator of nonfermentable carbon utilization, partial [Entomortierella beljakovae]